jgi:DNA-binding NarL/FixJ family response regulator
MASIKVLIADDHRIVRDGIKHLLSEHSEIEVISEAENGREAVKLALKLKPDVSIFDIGMPELNGILAISQLRKSQSDARVIVLSMHSEHEIIWKALKAGAFAYLLKDCASAELVAAIKQVYSGKKYISQDISDTVLHDFVDSKWHNKVASFVPISNREKEVLQLIAEGKSTKEIAEILFIGAKTAETHRRNIMEKLHLHTVSELTKYAIRNDITSLD